MPKKNTKEDMAESNSSTIKDGEIVSMVKSAYLTWAVGTIFAARVQLNEFLDMNPEEVIKRCKEINYQGTSLYELIVKNS